MRCSLPYRIPRQLCTKGRNCRARWQTTKGEIFWPLSRSKSATAESRAALLTQRNRSVEFLTVEFKTLDLEDVGRQKVKAIWLRRHIDTVGTLELRSILKLAAVKDQCGQHGLARSSRINFAAHTFEEFQLEGTIFDLDPGPKTSRLTGVMAVPDFCQSFLARNLNRIVLVTIVSMRMSVRPDVRH